MNETKKKFEEKFTVKNKNQVQHWNIDGTFDNVWSFIESSLKEARKDELQKLRGTLFTYQGINEESNIRATTEAWVALKIENRLKQLEKE